MPRDGYFTMQRPLSPLRALVFLLAVLLLAGAGSQGARAGDGISEKEAFESAKELGTIEAWEAFLNNFPSGFRADLARAYVRRLGTGAAPAQPQVQQPAQQAATPPPAQLPAPEPTLQTVDLGPGAASWRNRNYAMDEGNRTVYAASVQGRGVELTAYCTPQRRMMVVLSGTPRGVYPDFDKRVRQGLKAAGGSDDGSLPASVPIRFSNSNQYFAKALYQGLTGDVLLTDNGLGFSASGPVVEEMMAALTMTVSAPPFSATFQMGNSRNAICNMLKRCGVRPSGCGAAAPKSVRRRPAVRKKKKASRGCGAGKVFLEGRCIANSQVVSFCGPGYHRSGSKCVSNAASQPAPSHTCPRGLIWEIDRCVEDD